MRILHILGQRPTDTGSGIVVKHYLRQAMRAGHSVHLLHSAYQNESFGDVDAYATAVHCGANGRDFHGLIPGMSDVMPYPSVRYKDLDPQRVQAYVDAFTDKACLVLRQFDPDVIHVHHLWVLVSLIAVLDRPAVVSIHGTDLWQARRAPQHLHFVNTAIARARALIAVSPQIAQDARVLHALGATPIVVIPNGYDETVYNARDTQPSAKRPGSVVSVGKLDDSKGFDLLIEAMSAPQLRGTELTILGGGHSDERRTLEKIAEERGIDGRVRLLGHVSEHRVAASLRSASLFVSAARREAFGLAMLEALACGCPVLASATAGANSILSLVDGNSAAIRLISPLNQDIALDRERFTAELASCIAEMVPRIQSRRSRHALSRLVAHLSWTDVYALLVPVYHSVVASASS